MKYLELRDSDHLPVHSRQGALLAQLARHPAEQFYGLDLKPECLKPLKESWQVPAKLGQLPPFLAWQTLFWESAGRTKERAEEPGK